MRVSLVRDRGFLGRGFPYGNTYIPENFASVHETLQLGPWRSSNRMLLAGRVVSYLALMAGMSMKSIEACAGAPIVPCVALLGNQLDDRRSITTRADCTR